jgi:hypothetical protein
LVREKNKSLHRSLAVRELLVMQTLVDSAGLVKEAKRTEKTGSRLLFALAFLPPAVLLLLISRYGVDVMDWDQWKVAGLFEKASQGALTFSDLFAQQGEFRQLFPNLIFLGLGSLTHWNIRYEMLVTFSLACVVAFNLYGLGRVTLDYSDSTRHVVAFISSLLIFSPAQYENWLHGEQIIYLLPAACFTTALRAAYSELNIRVTVLIGMLMSTVATFSSPNGIICWVILAPVLFLPRRAGSRRRWLLVAWVIGFIFTLSLYVYGYHKPSYSPPLNAAFRHSLETTFFFIALLGAPLLTIYRLGFVGAALGAMMVVLFAILCRHVASVENQEHKRNFTAWLAVGAYSITTAMVVTIARVGYGVDKAFSSRYGGFFIYLAVSLCWLMPQILTDIRKKGRLRRTTVWGIKPEILVAAGLVLVHFANSAYAIHQMSAMRTKGLQDKACLLLVNVVEGECLTRGFPALEVVKNRTNAMNDLGYLRPRLLASNRVSDIAASIPQEARATGRFEGLERLADGTFAARGWAKLPGSAAPADMVLLAYENEGEPLIFALGEVAVRKHSIRRLIGGDWSQDGRWQGSFSVTGLPVRPVRISSWAFDALTGKAYALDGTFVIP